MSRKLLPLNPRQMVGLADGNSFYCSCEESMQPWLHGKPIIVASNKRRLCDSHEPAGEAIRQDG